MGLLKGERLNAREIVKLDVIAPVAIVGMKLLGKGIDHLVGWDKGSSYRIDKFNIYLKPISEIDEEGNIQFIAINVPNSTQVPIWE